MKYCVTVTEILNKSFEIEANNKDEAYDIVEANYNNSVEGYILDASDHEETIIDVLEPNNQEEIE